MDAVEVRARLLAASNKAPRPRGHTREDVAAELLNVPAVVSSCEDQLMAEGEAMVRADMDRIRAAGRARGASC